MKLGRRGSAAVLGLGVAGLLAAAVVGAGQRAASGSVPSAAVGGGTCQEWMCGTNHNHVLL
jgi:hypothetical protein